jgi:hypothetical protein
MTDSEKTWLWIESKERAEIVCKDQLLQVNVIGFTVNIDEGLLS